MFILRFHFNNFAFINNIIVYVIINIDAVEN